MHDQVTSGTAPANDPKAWTVPVGMPIGDFRVSSSDEGMLELRGNMARAGRMILFGCCAGGLGLLLLAAGFFGVRTTCYAVVLVVVGLMFIWGGFATLTLFQRYDAATQTLRTRQFLIFWGKYGPGTFSSVVVHVTAQGKPTEKVSVILKSLKSRAEDLEVSDSLTTEADAISLVMVAGQIARLLDLPIGRRGWARNGAVALTDALGLVPEEAA